MIPMYHSHIDNAIDKLKIAVIIKRKTYCILLYLR